MSHLSYPGCELYHEDCFDILPSIPDGSIHMILCDLPYTFHGKNRVTANSWDIPIDDEKLFLEYLRIISDDGAIVLFASNPFAAYLISRHLPYYKYEWVWEKDNGSNFINVKYKPFKTHELVLVFSKSASTFTKSGRTMKYFPQLTDGKPYVAHRDGSDCTNLIAFRGRTDTKNTTGKRYPRSVQKFSSDRGLHPTQKPVALCEYLIRTYTNPGDVVLDNTMGSGTTVVAALRSGRYGIGIEKDDNIFRVAKDRIENEVANIEV